MKAASRHGQRVILITVGLAISTIAAVMLFSITITHSPSLTAHPHEIALSPPMLLLSSTVSPAGAIAPSGCYKSFYTYAYQAPLSEGLRGQSLLPLAPWQIQAVVPAPLFWRDPINQVQINRIANGRPEIWMTLVTESPLNPDKFAIFRPEDKSWEVGSTAIGDTGLFVDRLFITSDGAVWGRTTWDQLGKKPTLQDVPMISRFNENTRRFEFAQGAITIRHELGTNTSNITDIRANRTTIIVDDQDRFWIFIDNDGIYRYDPVSRTTDKHADLPEMTVVDAVLSDGEGIYFEVHSRLVYQKPSFLRIVDGTLFQFVPDTKMIQSVELPDTPWPLFSGLLVDHAGKLWLGSIGYRDTRNAWHLIHPSPHKFFELADSGGYSYVWAPPHLTLESSDGILWYTRFLDTSGFVDGTAWFDPLKGEGCMFSNWASTVVEDSSRQLWFLADGKLYKNSLNQ